MLLYLSSSVYYFPFRTETLWSPYIARASAHALCLFAWGTLAPNDLLSVAVTLDRTPDPACALGAYEALGWGPLLIIGSLCEPVTRNECPTPAPNRRPYPLDLRARGRGLAGRVSLEDRARGEFSRLQESPERNQ
jgi:hypothetical protein